MIPQSLVTVQPGDGPPHHWANTYWFDWILISVASFLGVEIYALATGHPENTLSNFVWWHLKIHVGESITQWSAGDLLVACVYVTVFIIWLPWHFFFMRFR